MRAPVATSAWYHSGRIGPGELNQTHLLAGRPRCSRCAALRRRSAGVDRAGVEQHQVVLIDDLRVATVRQAVRDGVTRLHQHEAAVVGDHAAALRLQGLRQLAVADRNLVQLARAAVTGAGDRRRRLDCSRGNDRRRVHRLRIALQHAGLAGLRNRVLRDDDAVRRSRSPARRRGGPRRVLRQRTRSNLGIRGGWRGWIR